VDDRTRLGLAALAWEVSVDARARPWGRERRCPISRRPPTARVQGGRRVAPGRRPQPPGRGLTPGKYALKVDGAAVATAAAEGWAKGVAITAGPEFAQADKLRG